jgi:purine-binding chemotaxis protein CheW
MPPYITGLINRYGEPLVLFNSHILFESENTVKNIVIVIDSEEQFGIQVSEVVTFSSVKISELRYDSMFISPFFSFSIPFNGYEVSVINPFSFLELLDKEIKNV